MPNYIYMGHGYDKLIKNSETHENDFDYQDVPSGCNYLTIIKTAMTGDLRSVLNLIKINSTEKGRQYLDDPILYYDELSTLVADYRNGNYPHPIFSLNDLHLKVEGDKFINNTCDFLFIFGNGPIKQLYKSGLYNMSTAYNIDLELPLEIQSKFDIDTREGIDFHTISLVYKHSVFPTAKDIISEIKRVLKNPTRSNKVTSKNSAYVRSNKNKMLPNSNFNLNYTKIPYDLFVSAVKTVVDDMTGFSLMKKYPGNHYNFVCRSYENPLNMQLEKILLHRRESNNFANITRNRRTYLQHKTKNPILKFNLFVKEIMSNPTGSNGASLKHLRIAELSDPNLDYINSVFELYINKEDRSKRNIKIIKNFIFKLNDHIHKGDFTMKELPNETRELLKRYKNINIEIFLKTFFSNPEYMHFEETREVETVESILFDFKDILDLYKEGFRGKQLLYTIEHFIIELNKSITEGKFTVHDFPVNIIETLTEIINDRPLISNGKTVDFEFSQLKM